tara:strand:+ start:852 stop:1880 length:1029 start_codon:yes stop_codon:yes gene_type:complete
MFHNRLCDSDKLLIVGDPKGVHSKISLLKYKPQKMWVWDNDPRHFYTIRQIDARINLVNDLDFNDMHFSQCISNPPYKGNLHLEFLLKELNISDAVIQIHPSGWLYRTTKDIEKRVKNALKGRVKKIKFFNGNYTFPGAEFAAPLVETTAVKQHDGKIEVEYDFTGNKYFIDSLDELPSGYWEPTEKHWSIVNNIKNLAVNRNAYDYVVKIGDKATEKTLKAPEICGDGRAKERHETCKHDFWTFFYERSDLYGHKKGARCFLLNSSEERANLVSYLKTKFARFALSINKVSQHLYIKRYLDCVPVPPLNREWDDNAVFDYYHISQEDREYINSFIPDFYEV